MINKKINEITILIDFKIYLYLFEPIIKELAQSGVKLHIAAPNGIKEYIQENMNDYEFIFIDYELLKEKHKFRFLIHRVCGILFTRSDFSWQFYKKRNNITQKQKGIKKYLFYISKITPKIPNKRINKFLSSISGFLLNNPFPTKHIMAGSLNASPELLGASNQFIFTIMESWDHAVKEPNGYVSDVFFGWNESLCNDWKNLQGDKNCKVLHPLKLRYSNEIFKWNKQKQKKKFKVLYPVSSTKKFSIDILVKIERVIIEELVDACRKLNWDLFIKPRPNGSEGEFDYAKEYAHVEVGEVSHGLIDNPANYFYTQDDNKNRFKSLNDVDLVINAFTTFGLDAASANIPVAQLDLRKAPGFELSYEIYDNYHIKNYLINKDNVIQPQGISLSEALLSKNIQILIDAEAYSKSINNWLYKYENTEKAIKDCFNQYFNMR